MMKNHNESPKANGKSATDIHHSNRNNNNDENDDPDSLKTLADEKGCMIICEPHVKNDTCTTSYIDDKKTDDGSSSRNYDTVATIVRPNVKKEICKEVIRCKLMKRRHLIVKEGINPDYLKGIMPSIINNFQPQSVRYNGGVANITTWKISCYLEVMDHGVPTAEPNITLQQHCLPLLNQCNELFLLWYQQQHSHHTKNIPLRCRRLMTFITRYTPAPTEQALLKHIDGAGKVDGSVVVALPIDEWTAPYEINEFIGGGLTFWDGPKTYPQQPPLMSSTCDASSTIPPTMTNEVHYDTRSGDIAFIDRAVWHQADPITKGTRWALVIFYKIESQ